MSLTPETARTEVCRLLNEAWAASTPALNNGQPVRIEWEGVQASTPPPADAPHARHYMRHTTDQGQTLGQAGTKRHFRTGLITVQVFAPVSGGGVTLAQKLAIIARNAYEGVGTSTGLWFRNARLNEIGVDEGLFQINVLVEFLYDERR